MPNSRDSARKLFVHGAHRTVGVPSSAAATDPFNGKRLPAAKPASAPLEVVLYAGQLDEQAAALLETVRQSLGEILNANIIVGVSNAAEPARDPLLPDEADVAVLFGDTSSVGVETLEAIARYSSGGHGVVSLATAPDRRQAGRRFQWSVLGAQLIGSAESSAADIEIEPNARLHPVGRGLEASPWTTRLATAVLPLSADAMVLLSARGGEHRKPAAWVRQHGQGRVFGTLLGSESDIRHADFLQLVGSAVAWTSRREGHE